MNLSRVLFIAAAILLPATVAGGPAAAVEGRKPGPQRPILQLARGHCDLPPILKDSKAAIAHERQRLTAAGWQNVEIVGRVRSFSRCRDELVYGACRDKVQYRVRALHENRKRTVTFRRVKGPCPTIKGPKSRK